MGAGTLESWRTELHGMILLSSGQGAYDSCVLGEGPGYVSWTLAGRGWGV